VRCGESGSRGDLTMIRVFADSEMRVVPVSSTRLVNFGNRGDTASDKGSAGLEDTTKV